MLAELTSLHEAAARAALAAPFLQHRLLTAREFLRLCTDTGVGAKIGLSALAERTLEALHRLRLVVPLIVSEKGSDTLDPLLFSAYTPWSTFGRPGDSDGWTEVYYHPFQLWLTELAAGLHFPLVLTPESYELAAAATADSENLRSHAAGRMRRVHDLSTRTWMARFYEVFPLLILADQVLGPSIRGVWTDNHEAVIRRYGTRATARRFNRRDATWARWRRRIAPDRVRHAIADRRARLERFADEVWTWADFRDPLSGADWQDLLGVMSWRARESLRGIALGCHRLKELAVLAGELLAYAFGGEAEDYYDRAGASWTRKRLGGPARGGHVAQAALVTSRFGINPSPRVLWFVEGESEQACLELISKDREHILDRAGIRLLSLGGNGQLNLRHLRLAVRSARMLDAVPFVLADRRDAQSERFVDRAVNRGVLTKEQIHFSDPNFEEANFSREEREEVAKVPEVEDADSSPQVLNPSGFSKPETARRLTERFLLPELHGQLTTRERPIVRQFQAVLDAAARHDFYRPRYHPRIFGRA